MNMISLTYTRENINDIYKLTQDELDIVIELNCTNNKLTSIPHIKGLKKLYCSKNLLVNIPHIEGFKVLHCTKNQINNIPYIEGLKELYCSNNQLTSIPHIEGLKYLDYSNNPIGKITFESIELDSIDNCSICYEIMDKECVKTNCNHYFHKNCIDVVVEFNLKNNKRLLCPLCRTML